MPTQWKTIDAYTPLLSGKGLVLGINKAIQEAAQEAKAYGLALITARTPVDTGRLRSNWQAELEANGIRFHNDTPYGIFVEMGTYKMRAQPMLAPSIPEIQTFFAKRLGAKLADRIGIPKVNIATSETPAPTYQNLTGNNAKGSYF